MTDEQLEALIAALNGDVQKFRNARSHSGVAKITNNTVKVISTSFAANSSTDFDLGFDADWFVVRRANGIVGVNLDHGPQFFAWPRDVFTPGRFRTLTLSAFSLSGSTTLTVFIVAGKGTPPKVTTHEDSPINYLGFADVSCGAAATTQIFTSRPDVTRLMVSIKAGAANGLKLGPSTTNATHGLELPVGSVVTLKAPNDLYAYNAGAGAITVSLLAESS